MMEDISVNAADIPWERSESDPQGLQRKVLRRGSDDKPRVALLKLDAGFEVPGHAHDLAENHFVLEGMYESQGREYPAGSYHRIPAHATHGPFRSRGGALLVVMWEG